MDKDLQECLNALPDAPGLCYMGTATWGELILMLLTIPLTFLAVIIIGWVLSLYD